MLIGQLDPEEKINLLFIESENAINDSIKIEKLFSIARFYFDYMGDEVKADSISETALEVAVSCYRPEMLVFAYNLYIESNDVGTYYTKSID